MRVTPILRAMSPLWVGRIILTAMSASPRARSWLRLVSASSIAMPGLPARKPAKIAGSASAPMISLAVTRTTPRSGEQGRAERVFQRVDMAPDRRLGQAEAPRGAAEAQVSRDFEEGAKFVPGGFSAHTKMYSRSREICNSALSAREVNPRPMRRRKAASIDAPADAEAKERS